MFGRMVVEQGPIRPPNEAGSMLLRVTRNCPWNRCTFCPVYKEEKFSRRTKDEIKQDIDNLAAAHSGNRVNVFLQDADSLILKTEDLVEILEYLYKRISAVERVTSYARSRTLSRKPVEELARLKRAGLTRVHVGLESGSDEVLEKVQKGVSSAEQIEAGRRVKEAGLILSHYVILGLGGRDKWREHALRTAEVINVVNPDYIRVRTLGLHPEAPITQEYQQGKFQLMNDWEIIEEKKYLIENLEGITSTFFSDHILNLLEGVQGTFPEDKEAMLKEIEKFLSLPQEEKVLFCVGRRTGIFRYLEDRLNSPLRERAQQLVEELKRKEKEPEEFLRDLMLRFI